jgi:tetratricopeptide (TPR) repeat protein
MRSCWSLFRGEFSEAEQLAEEAARLGTPAQVSEADFTYRLVLFVVRREQGRLGEIEDLVRRSIDEYPGYRLFRCLLALLKCELGREADARSGFEELARPDFRTLPRDIEWIFCLSVLAEVTACIRDRDRAATLYGLLLPYARLNAVAAAAVAVGSVARYLGILATTTLQWDDAARHFKNALEMNERMGARPWLAHTQHDYARMLLARNMPDDRREAKLLLDEALATYKELGMPAAAARASALSRRDDLAPP